MRIKRLALGASSILMASIMLLSCNNDYGIFATVQGERKQEGTKVFQKTSVSSAFRLGSKYYAATGTLNARDTTSTVWSVVPIVSSSYSLLSAVLAPPSGGNPNGAIPLGTIYALIETGDSLSPTISLYRSIDGTAWTRDVILPAQTLTGSTIFSLDALYATSNGEVYAEGHGYTMDSSEIQPSTYSLYHLAGSSLDNLVIGTGAGFKPGVDKSIRGVVYDSFNSKYWFASEDLLYSGSKADGSDALDSSSTAAPGLTPANTIWDISYTGTGSSSYLYVSMKSGTLFRYQSIVETESGLSNPLTEVIEVPSSGSSNIILVGTDAIDTTVAEGYYEGVFPNLASGSTNSIVSSTSAVFSTTVGAFPIHGFYYDTVPESGITRLFVFTSPGTTSASYYGLYSSAWDSTHKLWSGWSAE